MYESSQNVIKATKTSAFRSNCEDRWTTKQPLKLKLRLVAYCTFNEKCNTKYGNQKKQPKKNLQSKQKMLSLHKKKQMQKSTRQNKNKTKRTTQQQKKNNLY